ncbi:LytR/AlgR family response regulator transcription factor [Streptomyces sp. HUAS TT20]|uniref:LytR/AlgR family response regulator transcription factor n=1 Tax=Streptomyces sp. HUAS TT20 TaxID=3447509 RepID=UPI0021DB44E8|nr:LytTR family DNA-binding domain-containing protein [Streptomyces sp. HUAS 15-9]UXY32033.1 LytTR family DNA-binding domain-containing protein [Streptomyces sp. HUAS 15-9]
MLSILVVDDEPHALEELVYLLGLEPAVGSVESAADGAAALLALDRALAENRPVDAVFLDIRMPGLDGLEVARVLSRFAAPPPVVFVTAYDDFAVPAFEVGALDYLLKPARAQRLAETVRRIAERRANPVPTDRDPAPAEPPASAEQPTDDQLIAVELSGMTRFVPRSEVRHVEACGDYVRLFLESGSHLLRAPLSSLEDQWQDAGFVRVHRRHLVATSHIEELMTDCGRLSVRVAGAVVPVSRRSSRKLREMLLPPSGPPRGQRAADG